MTGDNVEVGVSASFTLDGIVVHVGTADPVHVTFEDPEGVTPGA